MEKNRYNDSTNKGYIEYLDYCRALGAFVIVMLHSGIDAIQHFFIFALPMFFVISGFVYKPDKQTKRDYIKGRFKRLVIPFWGFTAEPKGYPVIPPLRCEPKGDPVIVYML